MIFYVIINTFSQCILTIFADVTLQQLLFLSKQQKEKKIILKRNVEMFTAIADFI